MDSNMAAKHVEKAIDELRKLYASNYIKNNDTPDMVLLRLIDALEFMDQRIKHLEGFKMGKCKNCKFWGVDYQKVCSLAEYANDDDSSFKINYGSNDDQGSWGQLITGPNFGCIKFEEKVS